MPPPKPCLGYPSRSAAVVALRQKGLLTSEIADRTGLSRKDVLALEASARRSGDAAARAVQLPLDVLLHLEAHALARGVSREEIARRIVSAAVSDDLVDAILDDRPEEAAA